MFSITTEQLNSWLSTLIWPLARILALLASTPLLGSSSIPTQTKLGLAVLLAILIAPLLPRCLRSIRVPVLASSF